MRDSERERIERLKAEIGELSVKEWAELVEYRGDGGSTSLADRRSRDRELAATTQVSSLAGQSTRGVLERLFHRDGTTNRYDNGVKIAAGGQGAILRVWDGVLRRHLAMKVINGQEEGLAIDGTNDLTLGRFLDEAQITGQLDHPGIVPVHELGVDDQGRAFFTMKLVQGVSLDVIIDRHQQGEERWSQVRVLGVVARICEAVSYAHAKGVIHRDLKPANVMVGEFGEVYVMDWGIAKIRGKAESRGDQRSETRVEPVRTERFEEVSASPSTPLRTEEGSIMGTPAFMSPEQARGQLELIDERTDVYAIGAILYQLLTGRLPYSDGDDRGALATIRRVLAGPPTSVRSLEADVSPALESICERAMDRKRHRRYRTAAALRDDLRAFLEGRVVEAHSTSPVLRVAKWIQRNKPLAAAIGLVLVLAWIVAIWGTRELAALEVRRELQRESETIGALLKEGELDDARDRLAAAVAEGLPSSVALQFDQELGRIRAERQEALATARENWRESWRGGFYSNRVRPADGHATPVSHIAYSPESTYLATAASRELRVWSVDTGEEAYSLNLERTVSDILWVGEDTLAVASAGGVAMWHLGSPTIDTPLIEIPTHDLVLSADGQRLAGVSDRLLNVWSLDDLRLIANFALPSEENQDCTFARTGRCVVTSSVGDHVIAHDIEEQESRVIPEKGFGATLCARGKHLGIVSHFQVTLWDLEAWSRLGRWTEMDLDANPLAGPNNGGIVDTVFTDSGLLVVAASHWLDSDGSYELSDYSTVFCFSPQARDVSVLFGDGLGSIQPGGLVDEERLFAYPANRSTGGVTIDEFRQLSREERRGATLDLPTLFDLAEWDLSSDPPRVIRQMKIAGTNLDPIVLAANGRSLASADNSHYPHGIEILDLVASTDSDPQARRFGRAGRPRRMESFPSDDHAWVATIEYLSRRLLVWNVESASLVASHDTPAFRVPPRIAIDGDGSVFVSADEHGATPMLYAADGTKTRCDVDWEGVLDSSLRPSGDRDRRGHSVAGWAILSPDNRVRVAYDGTVRHVHLSKDSSRAVVTGESGVSVYSVANRKRLQTLERTDISASSLSLDGRRVVSTARREVIVWLADGAREEGAEILRVIRPPFRLLPGSRPFLSPDGNILWIPGAEGLTLYRTLDGLEIARIFAAEELTVIPGGLHSGGDQLSALQMLAGTQSLPFADRADDLRAPQLVRGWLDAVLSAPEGAEPPLPPNVQSTLAAPK